LNPLETRDIEVETIPVELNEKYVYEFNPKLMVDLGWSRSIGLSIREKDIDEKSWL